MINDIVCFPKISQKHNIDVYVLIHEWHDIYNITKAEFRDEPKETIYRRAHEKLEVWLRQYNKVKQ
jgi:hypothetical protein